MSDERRQNTRFAVSWRGRIAIESKGLHKASIVDISKGGAGIVFDHALPLNSAVSIEFFVKFQGERHCIRAKCRVTFVAVLSDNRGAKVGLQFVAMSKESKKVLLGVIQVLEDSGF